MFKIIISSLLCLMLSSNTFAAENTNSLSKDIEEKKLQLETEIVKLAKKSEEFFKLNVKTPEQRYAFFQTIVGLIFEIGTPIIDLEISSLANEDLFNTVTFFDQLREKVNPSHPKQWKRISNLNTAYNNAGLAISEYEYFIEVEEGSEHEAATFANLYALTLMVAYFNSDYFSFEEVYNPHNVVATDAFQSIHTMAAYFRSIFRDLPEIAHIFASLFEVFTDGPYVSYADQAITLLGDEYGHHELNLEHNEVNPFHNPTPIEILHLVIATLASLQVYANSH